MCDPFSIAATAMTVAGQLKAGQDANDQANAQAGQLEYSGRVSQDDALARAMQIRKQGARDVGSANVAQAASGVVVGEGSGDEVDRTIAGNTEHDAHMAILTGQRQARGLNTEAAYTRQAGQNAQVNSIFNAAGTVMGSVNSYNRNQQMLKQLAIPSSTPAGPSVLMSGAPSRSGWSTNPIA